MSYNGVVRFIGILMGIIVVLLALFVGALMLLSGLNGTQSFATYYLVVLLLLLVLGSVIILISWRKKNKGTPIFFGIITVFAFGGYIIVKGAIGNGPETLLLIGGFLSAFLTYQTNKENKNI